MLDQDARAEWEAQSAAPPSEQEVRVLLQELCFPGVGSDVVWEILGHGGGNLVRFTSKKAFNGALKNKDFGKRGYVLERAFGAVKSRVWIRSGDNIKESLLRIQALSDSQVICTLGGALLTEKVLSKHDGGVLSVVSEKIRVECSLIKSGCDTTWSSTMQFCNELFLGLVSWNVLKEAFPQKPPWRRFFENALGLYFRSLENHCNLTHFAGHSAQEAAVWISSLLEHENVLQRNIDAVLPLLALFLFSRKDIYRCIAYRDKLRGLSTAGGRLVHLGLHLPDLPWTGKSEAQKTALAYRELSGVSRQSVPFPQARSRVTYCHVAIIADAHAPG